MTSEKRIKMKSIMVSESEVRQKKLASRLNGLKMNLADRKLKARTDYEDSMALIKVKLNRLEKQIAAFRNSGEGKWSQAKAEIDLALLDIESNIKSLSR